MPTILLLLASNIFMTIAWYWHLKGGMDRPLMAVVAISWGIALFEYCLAVPANRIGYASGWSAGQLKVTQEATSAGRVRRVHGDGAGRTAPLAACGGVRVFGGGGGVSIRGAVRDGEA